MLKIHNRTPGELLTCGWHKDHSFTADVAIPPGTTGEVGSPDPAWLSADWADMTFEGEITIVAEPYDGSSSCRQVVPGQPQVLVGQPTPDRGVIIRHPSDTMAMVAAMYPHLGLLVA